MRKFVEKSNSMSMINEYGSVLQDEEQTLLFNIANANGHMGNAVSTSSQDFIAIRPDHYANKRRFYELSSINIPLVTGSEDVPSESLSASLLDEAIFSDKLDEVVFKFLVQHYEYAYQGVYAFSTSRSQSSLNDVAVVRNFVRKQASCDIDGMTYRSLLKGSSSGAYIQAYFQGSYGDEIGLYPGVVMFFFDHFLWLPNRQRKLH
ncbi:hypothetical protein BD408DRAFT_39733 [Parasitella parasitica]|nr:hypothetical protein BD408DRAFT_39733 [Parasitella parasitica]